MSLIVWNRFVPANYCFDLQLLKQPPNGGLLLLPKSRNYPAFDGFLGIDSRWYPLQVTINAKKTLKPHLLSAFCTSYPNFLVGGRFSWFGVVPPAQARRRRKFPFLNSSEDLPPESVDQFVIPFPRPDDPAQDYSEADSAVLVKMKRDMFSNLKSKSRIVSSDTMEVDS